MDRNFTSARIGFAGRGDMIFPMGGNLAIPGFALTVADANKKAVDRFAAADPQIARPVRTGD